ncbi:MAG: ubiquinone/menaquinone biosynthesis methyltransferase [Acidimicrobiales bacterium]
MTELPRGEEKARAVRAMFDTIAPRYDMVNRVITFGLDRRWRTATVASLGLPVGSAVIDVACGTGDLCRELAGVGIDAVGLDFSAGMLAKADTTAPLVQADALRMPFPSSRLDGVVSGFALRNVTDVDALFAELARVLRKGGRLALLEASEPTQPILRRGHAVYFGHVVPLIGGALSDKAAYRYLPASMSYLPSGDEMLGMLRRAGFEQAQRQALSGGITQLLTATRAA